MSPKKINDGFHFYLSIGYLISLISVTIFATLEYSNIKNDIKNINKIVLFLDDKSFKDVARIERLINENSISRSKQIISIKKYLKLCYNNKKHNRLDFNSLVEDIEDLELEINTMK